MSEEHNDFIGKTVLVVLALVAVLLTAWLIC